MCHFEGGLVGIIIEKMYHMLTSLCSGLNYHLSCDLVSSIYYIKK